MAESDSKIVSALSSMIAAQLLGCIILLFSVWVIHNDFERVQTQLDNLVSTPQTETNEPQNNYIENWEDMIKNHNPSIGTEDAEFVLITYSDFQCPFCKTFSQTTINELINEYENTIKVVFKHFPLDAVHPEATIAAVAAQCAHQEGKFWEMHDELFSAQDSLSEESIIELANSLGMPPTFISCLQNEETIGLIESDIDDGFNASVNGTPTSIFNGHVLSGAVPIERIESLMANN